MILVFNQKVLIGPEADPEIWQILAKECKR